MAKKRKPVRLALEYCAAKALVLGLALLPLNAAAWVGRRLGDFMRVVDKRHRQRAYAQVADRLGLSGRELDEFVRRNFQSYGMTLAEFAKLGGMSAKDVADNIEMTGCAEMMRSLLAEGKGMIFITAHFGNWEWSNSIARPLGIAGGSIARPLDNPHVNEMVRKIRERNGLRILDKSGAIRKALGAIRNNGVVGILIDQDAGPRGMMSPFLGKPASTVTVPVELAVRTGCPMMVVGLKRGGEKKRFTMLYQPKAYRADPEADPALETRRLVDELNAALGELIMQAPEQWFWIHRRWKTENATYTT